MGAFALDFSAMTHIGRRPPRQYVDLASVPQEQWEIHRKLDEHWKRWVNSPERQHVARMFSLVRSEAPAKRAYGEETRVPLDRVLAMNLAKAVAALPEQKHREALVWFYLKNGKKPVKMARELGVSLEGLAELVKVARTMLRNRRV